jgi:hypothetical protein
VIHKLLGSKMTIVFLNKNSLLQVMALVVRLMSYIPIQTTSIPVTTPKPLVFKITEVVDKLTGDPVRTNNLTIRIGRED